MYFVNVGILCYSGGHFRLVSVEIDESSDEDESTQIERAITEMDYSLDDVSWISGNNDNPIEVLHGYNG